MLTGTKTTLAVTAGVMVLAAGAYAWMGTRQDPAPIKQVLSRSEGAQCCVGGGTDPSHPTLDPARFQGDAKQAYEIARRNPALLAQLHCYCGCDNELGHRNLLDCFRTDHGSHCEICTGEAIEAERLAQRGMPVEQIRDALRAEFAHGS
jgi:Protein of unknown function with PCYCGC motif